MDFGECSSYDGRTCVTRHYDVSALHPILPFCVLCTSFACAGAHSKLSVYGLADAKDRPDPTNFSLVELVTLNALGGCFHMHAVD